MANDLGAFIAAEVGRAETDYQNVRTRALNLVGVSGGLVALIAALLGIAHASSVVHLPVGAKVTAGFAMAAFVVSAVCALVVNSPATVTIGDAADLRELVESEQWEAEGWDRQVASLLVDYLESLRTNNNTNAEWLMASIGFQIGAVVLLVASALIIIA